MVALPHLRGVTSREAEAEIVRCETDPDPDAMIGDLVDKWGTGNHQFDLHLASHLDAPSCGDSLREAFAEEIGGRPIFAALGPLLGTGDRRCRSTSRRRRS